MKANFFRQFQVLYLIEKQAYKIEFIKKLRIQDDFYMLLLEQKITRREWVDKNVKQLDFDANNDNSKE